MIKFPSFSRSPATAAAGSGLLIVAALVGVILAAGATAAPPAREPAHRGRGSINAAPLVLPKPCVITKNHQVCDAAATRQHRAKQVKKQPAQAGVQPVAFRPADADQPMRVLVAGAARCGSTWAANVLGHATDTRIVYEPDGHNSDVLGAVAATRLGEYPVLEEGEFSYWYRLIWDLAFAGGWPWDKVESARAAGRRLVHVPPLMRDYLVAGPRRGDPDGAQAAATRRREVRQLDLLA